MEGMENGHKKKKQDESCTGTNSAWWMLLSLYISNMYQYKI